MALTFQRADYLFHHPLREYKSSHAIRWGYFAPGQDEHLDPANLAEYVEYNIRIFQLNEAYQRTQEQIDTLEKQFKGIDRNFSEASEHYHSLQAESVEETPAVEEPRTDAPSSDQSSNPSVHYFQAIGLSTLFGTMAAFLLGGEATLAATPLNHLFPNRLQVWIATLFTLSILTLGIELFRRLLGQKPTGWFGQLIPLPPVSRRFFTVLHYTYVSCFGLLLFTTPLSFALIRENLGTADQQKQAIALQIRRLQRTDGNTKFIGNLANLVSEEY